MKHKIKNYFFIISGFLLVTISGCDQIAAIKEYFYKSKKTSETTQEALQGQKNKGAQRDDEEGQETADILARVGNWSISKQEFEERLQALKRVVPDYDIDDPQARAMVLEELIRQQLLVEDAEESGLAEQKDIQAAVEEFRRTLIVREVAKNLTEGVHVTDQEARDFYEEKKDLMVEPTQWRVREIVLETQEEANALLIELLKGADFAEKAKELSIGETASKGGDLGFITDVPFAQMANPLLSLEVGDISSVFRGPKGFYIIKLEEKKGGKPIAFEDIKQDIINNQIILKQQKILLDYIEQLKQKFPVRINEELLK